ncbi:hypothetical protein, partial [Fulvivirga kasyanovii]|uniref:hypothetical protein n=1 Tax=Fulvivirga kasyanovii TaxID=396812 RepID=UPI001C8678BD
LVYTATNAEKLTKIIFIVDRSLYFPGLNQGTLGHINDRKYAGSFDTVKSGRSGTHDSNCDRDRAV